MAWPACGLDLTALTRPDFSRSFVELQNLCTETRTDDFLTGWWCNFTILKNDGISQWVFHYPIYYIYEMENKIDVWNHQPVKDLKDVKECRNAAVFWSSSLTSLDQEAPVLARLPPLFCLVSDMVSVFLQRLPSQVLERIREKYRKIVPIFLGTALSFFIICHQEQLHLQVYTCLLHSSLPTSLGHVPFDQFDQSKENSTESITDLIRVRHIQTRFRRKWEKQASNAEEF